MKVILCGYNWIGCKALTELLDQGYEVYVYTHENPYYVNSLIDLCEKLNVGYTTNKISKSNIPFIPDIICSIYYRYIIDKEIIDIVKGKIFNLHPSLLPKYKGCSSITWALINGENKTGFTFHYIDQGIDTGNIILQKEINIEDWDTQIDLYHRVMYEASKYFLEVLQMVIKGFVGYTQDLTSGNYYKRGCPYNGEIDPKWSLDKIERFIRAMYYPPLPFAKYGNDYVKTLSEYKKLINK
ncbi:MAG: formyltransferase family protein [Flavobacteriaceae bacterium]